MVEQQVFMVLLRQPRSDKDEMRSDPFWEFGSFGCTGCHSKNLLREKNAKKLNDSSLAFAQGGNHEFRLVYITPPVIIKEHKWGYEVQWDPSEKPFNFRSAPVLFDTDDFPKLTLFLEDVKGGSLAQRFASRFRSRTKPLCQEIAGEISSVYKPKRTDALDSELIEIYTHALPFPPPRTDYNREKTLKILRMKGPKGYKKLCGGVSSC